MRQLRQPQNDGHFFEEATLFEVRSPVHRSLRRLASRLDKAGIIYAVMGGMALYAHGLRRVTDNLDVLVTPEGFSAFQRLHVPSHYTRLAGHERRFTDSANRVPVDFFLTGHHPGISYRGPIAFLDPADVRESKGRAHFVEPETLVCLKLAAGQFYDLADVVSLIAALKLDESFAERLHPSLRRAFIGCLEELKRDEEFDARIG
jgi:hypothetical protein